MAEELTARDSGIDLREAGGGWRMYTRARYAPYVERLSARRRPLQADPRGAGDVGGGGVPPAGDTGAGECGARRERGRGDATLLARGLITEAGTDPDTGAVTFATTELFLERLGLTSLTDLPDIAPLLPDVDVDRRPERNARRRATFRQAQRCRPPTTSGRCPSTWTRTEMAELRGRACCRRVLSQAGIASRARRREDDRRRSGRGRRPGGHRARHAAWTPTWSVIRVDGARVMVDDTLVHLAHQQAARACTRRCPTTAAGRASVRSGRASGPWQQEALSRRTARRRHRRADAADATTASWHTG